MEDEAKSKPAEVELEPAPKYGRPRALVLAAVGVGLIMTCTTWCVVRGGRQWTNDAYVEAKVVQISPRVSGQVLALYIDDNVEVKTGDVLLEIDPADYQAQVEQARAAEAAGESQIKQAEAVVLSAEAAIGEAEAAAHAARTTADQSGTDYRRYLAMGTDGVSEQQTETAKAAADAADDQWMAATKKVTAANAELNVAQTNVATARAQVAAAKAQLDLAELQLGYTKVIAPVSGFVTKKNVERGAFVGAGQALFAIVPRERWVIANFKEVQLAHMAVGQKALVSVDAEPGVHFVGRIQSFQAGTGARFELLPPENATGNWVKVVQRVPIKITLDPGQAALERICPGLSAEVTIVPESGNIPSDTR
jgi:membrane fusion protein (multidrug efflux system)